MSVTGKTILCEVRRRTGFSHQRWCVGLGRSATLHKEVQYRLSWKVGGFGEAGKVA